MYQELWIVFTFEFFALLAAQEQKQRTASLIVLPPLVLGYDELYEDKSPEEKIETPKQKLKPNPQAKDKQKLKPNPQAKDKQKLKPNPQAKNKPKDNQKKLIDKDGKAGPNIKRTDVKFIRQGHKLNFMGHFLLPHNETECPFHDSPDPKFEMLNFVNRRSQGNLNLHRHLENIVQSNLLKSLVRPQTKNKTVDDKSNLVVRGNVPRTGGSKVTNKGDNKPKEIVTAKNKAIHKPKEIVIAKNKGIVKPEFVKLINKGGNKQKETIIAKNIVTKPKQTSISQFGEIESNITKELRELAVGLLSGILLNQ